MQPSPAFLLATSLSARLTSTVSVTATHPPLSFIQLARFVAGRRLSSSYHRRISVNKQDTKLLLSSSSPRTAMVALNLQQDVLHKQNYASLAGAYTSSANAIASTSSSGTGSEARYAPSLAHLDATRLPLGYEKAGEGAPFATFSPSIEQSPNDDRSYRLIRLDNGIECMLVSDPTTDKSAAGISVRVGHLSDPENAQGMAHFCEHLLFMGTEKYPAENDYNEYLSQNNGMSNAYTGMDETVYFFDVHPPALGGALDRFAQFFIAPLFTDSCTEREILAVDSENKKNLQSDMWRLFQLEKSTSSKSHHYWRFGTGNKQTLWDTPLAEGRGIRNELIEWYKKHYSANVMKLTVVGKESLDDLAKLVASCFNSVPNTNVPPKDFSGSPYTPEQLQQSLYAQTVKNIRSLELLFPIADQEPLFATKPGHFVTHYLGHEGEGSILACLKKLGWAESLSAGAGSGASGFDFFKINIQLTSAGMASYKQVVQIVFKYIDLLRNTDPQEWAFKEQSMLNEIGFRFMEKGRPSSYVVQLCTQMQKPFPREWLLSAPWLFKQWKPELVRQELSRLVPSNCRITLAAQEPVEGLSWDKKEPWYGTKYTIQPFTDNLLNPSPDIAGNDLFLPPPNTFVPESLDLHTTVKSLHPARRPRLVLQTPTSRVWFKQDDRWMVPRAGVAMYIKSPYIQKSASTAAATRMYLDLVMDAMAEYSYAADLAGLSYKLDTQADGILLQIEGYNDKLQELAKVVIDKMASLQISEERFAVLKDQNMRKYENFKLAAPSGHTGYYMSYLTQKEVFTPDAKLDALRSLTPDILRSHIAGTRQKLHFEVLVHGNMLEDEARSIVENAELTLDPQSLSAMEKQSPLSLLPPTPSNLVLRLPVPNPENVNSAIEYFCYVGDDADPDLRTKNMLFCQLINEPCFDTLRTKEQLGYLVHSSGRASVGMTGFRISIQSERSAAYLEDRVDRFLLAYEEQLQNFPGEQFERERASLTNRLREDYKNLFQEMGTYFAHIHSGYYDFERKTKDAEIIERLTLADILAFYRTYISPQSAVRSKVSVHMQSQSASKELITKVAEVLSEAGLQASEELAELLQRSPPPLAEEVVIAVERRLSGQEGLDITEIVEGLREVQEPAPAGGGKTLYTDITRARSLFKDGPPAVPVAEYRETILN